MHGRVVADDADVAQLQQELEIQGRVAMQAQQARCPPARLLGWLILQLLRLLPLGNGQGVQSWGAHPAQQGSRQPAYQARWLQAERSLVTWPAQAR